MLERWNTHFSVVVEQELFGIELQLAQDPNSSNLGTTVWDASIVLAKYIEKNSRRGDFSRPKVRGKRVLELGAGMGLAGMAMALLGADVDFTDIGDVLPLLRRNVQENISPAALKVRDAAWAANEVGAARVASLDWSDTSCYASFQPPYDFILAADCVYSELAVPHLLATVLHMGGPRTQTIITNEFRSQAVHDIFMEQFGRHFAIRQVPVGKQDPNFTHHLIRIYLLKRRKQPLEGSAAAAEGAGRATQTAGAAAAVDAAGAEAGAAEGAAAGAGAPEAEAAGGAQAEAQAAGAAAAGGAAVDGSTAAATAHAVQPAAAGAADAAGAAEAAGAAAGIATRGPPGRAAEEGVGAADGGSAASGGSQSSSSAAKYQQQFRTRRQGAMLARVLKDVKL